MSKKKTALSIVCANLYLPLLAVMFPFGGAADILGAVVAMCHIVYLAFAANKMWKHMFLSLNTILSCASGILLNTYMYYSFISDDAMTPVVGSLIAAYSAQIHILVLVVSVITRSIITACLIYHLKKYPQTEEDVAE